MAFFQGRGDSFASECLQVINEHRAKHQVPALRLNSQISKISQNWAEQMARNNDFSHNKSALHNNNDLGENIAMKWSSDKRQFPGREIVDMWYNEIKNYNFRTNSGPKTGHFTQLVWKASVEVGIGKAISPDGKFLVVANFNPPGNFIGKFAENVLPPSDGKVTIESGSKQLPKTTITAKSTQVEDSMRLRATPAFFPRGISPTPSHGRSDVAPVRPFNSPFLQPTTSGPSVTSSPNFGLQGSNVTRRQIVQETSGHVTKTVVIETIQNADGSSKTVQTESSSSRSQPVRTTGFEEIERKFGLLRTNRDEGTTHSVTSMSPCTASNKTWNRPLPSTVTTSSNPWSRGTAEREEIRVTLPSSSIASTCSQSMKEFTDDVIRSHNKYRRKHGQVGDLRVNRELNDIAQRWADRLVASRALQHSQTKFKGLPLGENLACKFGSGKVDYRGDETVNDWYAEIKNYDFRNSDRSTLMSTGHFTQVVWKGSTEIGVGKASSADGSVFVVCNYFPAGNVIGKFRENVLPGN